MNRPILQMLNAGRGTTPPCPEARFKRGDVVKVSRRRGFEAIPAELIVAIAIPRHFSPDYALADLLGESRPLMISEGSRAITYILVGDGDPKPYLVREADLRPSGKEPVEIGTIGRAAA